MYILALGAAGTAGILYFLLNLWWPGWYLDWLYRRNNKRIADKVLATIMQGKLLIDLFEDNAKLIPKKAFILYNDEVFTYEHMDRLANRAARAAIEIGVKPGSTIAVMINNDPSIVWCYLGMDIELISFLNKTILTANLIVLIN